MKKYEIKIQLCSKEINQEKKFKKKNYYDFIFQQEMKLIDSIEKSDMARLFRHDGSIRGQKIVEYMIHIKSI